MKYKESYDGMGSDILDLYKKAIPDTFIGKLKESGVAFELPTDKVLDLKVKYSSDEEGGACALEVTWSNDLIDDDEDENEDESED
jgi:hypothetical protein